MLVKVNPESKYIFGPLVGAQTTNAIRALVLNNIEKYLSPADKTELDQCTDRLMSSLSNPSAPGQHTVLVMYGGGKDSTYLTGVTRYIQLKVALKYGVTFKLRVVTNRHAGMPIAVMENIGRLYEALGFDCEPDVELLLIDGNEVKPFSVDAPLPERIREQNRLDILMTGHKTRGMNRPTFCNACNLSMVNAMIVGLRYGDGADLMVTGDSPREQKDYHRWILRTSRSLGLQSKREHTGLRSTLQAISDIGEHYFLDIYRDDQHTELRQREISVDGINREPVFFSIFGDTRYEAGAHWRLLTEGLGFVFDEVAFAFTESDCGNPGLMCHLHGLKMERLHNLGYEEGVKEYVRFAVGLMEKKNFPAPLIEIVRNRYRDPVAIGDMRQKMNRYSLDAFHLDETQLVCMLYSPFAEQGKFLNDYLQREQPELAASVEEIRALLDAPGEAAGSEELTRKLSVLSGLLLRQLRSLYQQPLAVGDGVQSGGAQASPILVVLERDPHKQKIRSHRGNGEFVDELITGR